ncbi:MAG: 3-hydroxyacyl-ACP dehydratase FabZ [Helicobacter sp.]|nr:3-hydroxyacyl-ACP dehydratase FabZ [Helicobacter sp.]
MDITKIQQILPHRYPFLLIDRVSELRPNESIKAYKNVTFNEGIFQGHFPGRPIYPGVMIIEGMAQAGGLLGFVSIWGEDFKEAQNKIVYFMTIDRVKFRVPVTPGDKLVYELSIIKNKGAVWQFDGKAFVDDKLVAEAELKAMIADKKE